MHQQIKDYWVLFKPRITALVMFTAMVGMLIAPGDISFLNGLAAILCIAIGSSGASCINMWYDRDIDKLMARTKHRPLPSGRIRPLGALLIGISAIIASAVALSVISNVLAGCILIFATLFYAVVYTMWLKRTTVQNIVIGGLAGALPPLIGWVVVTANIALEPCLLTLIIFLWTPPHFWSLALVSSKDYMKAKVPMMPNIAGVSSTKRQIFFYTLILALVSTLPVFILSYGMTYLICSLILNSVFIFYAFWLLRDTKYAMRLFEVSILYLFCLFTLIVYVRFLS